MSAVIILDHSTVRIAIIGSGGWSVPLWAVVDSRLVPTRKNTGRFCFLVEMEKHTHSCCDNGVNDIILLHCAVDPDIVCVGILSQSSYGQGLQLILSSRRNCRFMVRGPGSRWLSTSATPTVEMLDAVSAHVGCDVAVFWTSSGHQCLIVRATVTVVESCKQYFIQRCKSNDHRRTRHTTMITFTGPRE